MTSKLATGIFSGKIEGDAIAEENVDYLLTGMVTGNLEVRNAAVVNLTGTICKNLKVFDSAKVVVNGMVLQSVIVNGGVVEIYGMISGDVIRKKGSVTIGENAKVSGKVST